MNIELLTEALAIWQEGPKFNKEDYHSSTGFLSNSFIGDFVKCEYDSVIRYAIKTESEFNEIFAIGHAAEAYIFEGAEGFNKKLAEYKDNSLGRKTKPNLISEILQIDDRLNKSELNKLKMPDIYWKCNSLSIGVYDKSSPKTWVKDSIKFGKSVTRHKKYIKLFRS